MQITLSQEQTQVLETLVEQGQYASLEDALNTALLLLLEAGMEDRPTPECVSDYAVWLETTCQKINAARSQVERGEVLDADIVLTQLRAKIQKPLSIKINGAK